MQSIITNLYNIQGEKKKNNKHGLNNFGSLTSQVFYLMRQLKERANLKTK